MATGKKAATPTPEEQAAAADIAERDHENQAAVETTDAPAEQAVERESPDVEEPKPSIQRPSLEGDEARDAIVAKRKEQRKAEDEPAAEAEAGTAKDDAEVVDKPEEEAAAPAKADEQMVELVVDGQKINKPLSEIVAIAQKNVAADSRLDEAKRLLAETRTLVTQPAKPAADQPPAKTDEPQPGRADQRQATKPDPARVASVVDAFLTGDAEAGAKALTELLETTANPEGQTSPEQVRALVDAELQRRETEAEGKRAIDGLAKEFPEVAQDRNLFLLTLSRSVEEMSDDMLKIGVPEDEIKALGGDPNRTRQAYQFLRRDPQWAPKLRNFEQIAQASGKFVSERYVVRKTEPAPKTPANGSVVVADKSARKAALTPQPRSASTRSAEVETPAAPQQRTRSSVVRAIAAERGQPAA